MNNIPGLEHLAKEGWEIVRYDFVSPGECYVGNDDTVWKWDGFGPSAAKHIIIRKIEKPKAYRPFADAAEFKPHRDRWARQTRGDDVSFTRIDGYGKEGVTIQGNAYRYQELLDNRTFDDGSPFGVEVAE